VKQVKLLFVFLVLVLTTFPLESAERITGRYALILSDPAPAERFASRHELRAAAGMSYRQQIDQAQKSVRDELSRRRIGVLSSANLLLNAVFVQASQDQEAELRSIPGVQRVVPVARLRLKLDRAVQLVNAPAAWNRLGGVGNAGAGIKIGIIDTGIEQTHPAFQDNSLAVPAGFPKCQGNDCAFTNNKVIVARSYVRQLAAGTPPNPAVDSHPDDYSPRDRVGHGTALAMIAAGETNSGPLATITGMAPKAYLGNYKIFGSPGVIDYTGGDVMIAALEDALNDGMDIVVLSLGSPAFSGPLDAGAACGVSSSTPCDPEALAVENAVRAGMLVVAAAGNEGDTGLVLPTLNTIDSPGDAPSAIAVGATTNSHTFVSSVYVNGNNVPSGLQRLNTGFSDGPLPSAPLAAPLRDVTTLGNDGLLCTPVLPTSLAGSIALVQRGTCTFLQKVTNAQNAGAVGVVIYNSGGSQGIIVPGGLGGTAIPTAGLSNADGVALKSFLSSNPGISVTLDPSPFALDVSVFNTVADFSSQGPAVGFGAIKPDMVAVGTDLYLAAQRFDPNGVLYSPSGYIVSQGTSFSAPMVAGAAALVKQSKPTLTASQLKSLLVNTASPQVTDDFGVTATVAAMGAGKLDAGSAVTSNVTVEPATISFGILTSTTVQPQALQIKNTGSSPLSLTFSVAPRVTDPNAQVRLDKTSLSLGPGASGTLTATLSGRLPNPGFYEGVVSIQGGAVPLRIPYLYVEGDGFPANIIPIMGDGFAGTVNELTPDGAVVLKVIDRYGAPVSGVAVQWAVTQGGGRLTNADSRTDIYGFAGANAYLGPQLGAQQFAARAAGTTITFSGAARLKPTISANGAVNAASFQAGPVTPGSYISLFGSGLSDDTRAAATASLPLSLDSVSVSFDVPAANLSLPGRLLYVSPGQVNLQVPWELQGQSSAQIKVSVEFSSGVVYTLPLAAYSPAIFEYTEASSGTRLAAAQDAKFALIGSANPAQRGQTIVLYANGLGPVDNPPATGEPAPAQPLANTLTTPVVTIGGERATVTFGGLAPGFPALYQINAAVPPNVAPGIQPVVVSIGGTDSKPVSIPIQ